MSIYSAYEENLHELFYIRYRDMIKDFDKFFDSLRTPMPVGLRLNKDFADVEKFKKKFSSYNFITPIEGLDYLNVDSEKSLWGGALEHHLGHFFIQGLSSLLPVLALGVSENDRVLDMCAAPGGKTIFLAEQMNYKGLLVANEPSLGRRRVLKANMSRMGVHNALVTTVPGQELNFPKGSFSKILLDGPCSSEGTLRISGLKKANKKELNYLSYNERFRKGLHEVQASLLEKAYELLAEGGELVYSTCTYDPHENEKQVTDFLNKYPDVKLVELDISSQWESALEKGIQSYQNEEFHRDIMKTRRIYPHRLNSIGFYVAKFIKP